jgi:hypothetical protein
MVSINKTRWAVETSENPVKINGTKEISKILYSGLKRGRGKYRIVVVAH